MTRDIAILAAVSEAIGSMVEHKTATPRCDMAANCAAPVTHIDNQGFIYCTHHGIARKSFRPCRKLRTAELTRIIASR
jgi:hypothetical protein